MGDRNHLKDSEEVEEQAHSQGVAVDFPNHKRVYISGQVPIDDQGNVVHKDDIEKQTEVVLDNLKSALASFDGDISDIVRVRVYVVGLNDERFEQIHAVRNQVFDREHHPASTLVEVENLVRDGAIIEIDADAIIPKDGWEVEAIALDSG